MAVPIEDAKSHTKIYINLEFFIYLCRFLDDLL